MRSSKGSVDVENLHLGMVSLHEGDNDDIIGKTNRRR